MPYAFILGYLDKYFGLLLINNQNNLNYYLSSLAPFLWSVESWEINHFVPRSRKTWCSLNMGDKSSPCREYLWKSPFGWDVVSTHSQNQSICGSSKTDWEPQVFSVFSTQTSLDSKQLIILLAKAVGFLLPTSPGHDWALNLQNQKLKLNHWANTGST